MEANKEKQIEKVESRIIVIRGQQVILDRDVADLYGVETKRINEAIRNNPEKFPKDFILTLQPAEKQEVVENFDRLKTLHDERCVHRSSPYQDAKDVFRH